MKITDIDVLHNIYKSDIRSIINFLQLNQNINKNEWKLRMLDDTALYKLHSMICNGENKLINIVQYMHDISKQYNVDKKSIILSYINLIIRKNLLPITDKFLLTVEHIMHNNQLQSIELLEYFYINMQKHVQVM